MIHIHNKQLVLQLKADLIGKDSYRGVSLTYSWLANQFGHFALGFFPAFILNHLPTNFYGYNLKFQVANAIISSVVLWVIFESYNFLWPLLFKKSSGKLKLNLNNTYTFQPDWLNVGFDTATDVFFFATGASFLALFDGVWNGLDLLLPGLLILLFFPARYWYKTKFILQNCKFPEQTRLSQWNFVIDDYKKALVLDFIRNPTEQKHLLLSGHTGSGKTSLAIGICTELAIKRNSCYYLIIMKLSSLLYKHDTYEMEGRLWNWRNCDCLIIDDINPSEPIREAFIQANDFLKHINNSEFEILNKKALTQKKLIWVIGEKSNLKDWQQLLNEIGIDKNSLVHLDLS